MSYKKRNSLALEGGIILTHDKHHDQWQVVKSIRSFILSCTTCLDALLTICYSNIDLKSAFTTPLWGFPWLWLWPYLSVLLTLKLIGPCPLKATAKYMYFFTPSIFSVKFQFYSSFSLRPVTFMSSNMLLSLLS